MAKKTDSRPGYGKLLDAWIPPENAGKPIGCLATTFTFSPEFFEEECLARFINLESEPSDGPAYLIEREEKLSQLNCVSVLVDQQHCRGSRNLRWDLIPSRANALQHAKISLLVWTDYIRVIIGSANLTEDGYRRNQEVFGVLNFMPDGQTPLSCLVDTIRFLRPLASYGFEVDYSAEHLRWNKLLDSALAAISSGGWGLNNAEALKSLVRVSVLFSGPGYPTVFESLRETWPEAPAPNLAAVVSPFFDPPEAENRPITEVWNLLSDHDESTLEVHLNTEPIPGEETVYVHGPETLELKSGKAKTQTSFHALALETSRPLHAKSIWLQNDRWALYMIGSSNFTSAGTGCGGKANFEANIVYLVDSEKQPHVYKQLVHSFPESELIKAPIKFKPIPNEDEESEGGLLLLPKQFVSATFDVNAESQGSVTIQLGGVPDKGWQLITENNELIFDEAAWIALDRPDKFTVPWNGLRPPSGFHVCWPSVVGSAWLPINVRNSESLPPPDELKDLPLEVLLDILTSARPIHQVLNDWGRRNGKRTDQSEFPNVINPHKRVDTSMFLLQRTRRVSWALNALRERIEKPAATLNALRWRLSGPVGVRVFAEALVREAKSRDEQSFLLSELALELARAKPVHQERCVPVDQHTMEIRQMIYQLKGMLPHAESTEPNNLQDYVDSVFETVAS